MVLAGIHHSTSLYLTAGRQHGHRQHDIVDTDLQIRCVLPIKPLVDWKPNQQDYDRRLSRRRRDAAAQHHINSTQLGHSLGVDANRKAAILERLYGLNTLVGSNPTYSAYE